jgi:hypothetical protein
MKNQPLSALLLLITALVFAAVIHRAEATALAQTGVMESPLPTPTVGVAQPGRPIFGQVLLQGRRDFSGTAIYFTPESCDKLAQPPAGSATIITTGTGYFELIPVEAQSFGCAWAVQPGYLSGQKANPQDNLGSLTLPGGDVTGDNLIDIFDIATIGRSYGDSGNSQVDINRDGFINIFDLVLSASNYGLKGPVSDWK